MHREAEKYPGAMAAVLGLTPEKLKGLVHPLTKEGPIALANFNTPEQTVISGSPEMVARAGNAGQSRRRQGYSLKGLRGLALAVDGGGQPGISPRCMAKLEFRAPRLPLYLNATATTETDPGVLQASMAAQLTSPVRWAELILNLRPPG